MQTRIAIAISIMLLCTTAWAQQRGIELGCARLTHSSLNFKAFERHLGEHGHRDFATVMGDKTGYSVSNNAGGGRYFIYPKVDQIKTWSVDYKYPKPQSILLAEVHLRIFLYDTLEQKTIFRETFIAHEAGEHGDKASLGVLQRAFQKSIVLAANRVIEKLPLMGTILETQGQMMTVNLGKDHGVSETSIFEIIDANGKLQSEARIWPGSVTSKECKAGSMTFNVSEHDWKQLRLRLKKAQSEVANDRDELVRKLLVGKAFDKSERQIAPNPLVKLTITEPANGTEIYMGGGEGSSSSLKVKAVDAWGDEVEVKSEDIKWQVRRGDKDLISGSQFIHKRAGTFEIIAQHGETVSDPIQITTIRIEKLTLSETEGLTIGPGLAYEFPISGVDSNNNKVRTANLLHQIEWDVSPKELGEIVDGKFTAANKPGKGVVTAFVKSDPTIKARVQVLVLPPIQVEIQDLDGKRMDRNVNLIPGGQLELQYKVTCEGINPLDIPLKWEVSPEDIGEMEVNGGELFFVAKKAYDKRVTIGLTLEHVPESLADRRRSDRLRPIYVRIEKLRPEKIEITPLSQPPYEVEEPLQLRVEAIHDGKPMKNVELEVKWPADMCKLNPVGRGVYTLIPTRVGSIILIAVDKASDEEGQLQLEIKDSGVGRIDLTTDDNKREIRPGEGLICKAIAYKGEKQLDVPMEWSISPDGKKTSIDNTGYLLAGGEDEVGEYTITVRESRSGKSKSITVRVAPEPVDKVEIQAPKTLEVGKNYPLTAKIVGKDGNVLNRQIEWSTFGGGKVDGNGHLSAIKPGVIRVYASVDGVQTSVPVEITEAKNQLAKTDNKPKITIRRAEVTSMTVKNRELKYEISPGETLQFYVQARSHTMAVPDVEVEWSLSSDQHSIDKYGFFKAGDSTGTVIVTAREKTSNISESYKLKVRWEPVDRIDAFIASKILAPGEATRLSATPFDKSGREVQSKIVWTKTGGFIEEEQGHTVYRAPWREGRYTIWANDPSGDIRTAILVQVSKSKDVTSRERKYTQIRISPDVETLEVGASRPFRALVYDGRNWYSDVKARWRIEPSGNDHSIDADGNFTAGSRAGSFRVVAEVSSQGSVVKNEATVNVKRNPQKIEISERASVLRPGMSQQFTANVYDAQGKTMSIPVEWSVQGENRIDSSGNFTAGNQPGVYVVTARAKGQEATVEVKILQAEANIGFVTRNSFGLIHKMKEKWRTENWTQAEMKGWGYFFDEAKKTGLVFMILPMGEAADMMDTDYLVSQMVTQSFSNAQSNLIDSRNHTINNLSGKLLTYKVTEQGEEGRSTVFAASKDGNFYMVICAASEAEWNVYWPEFEVCLESLKVGSLDPVLTAIEVPAYHVSYRVDSAWTAKTIVDSATEKAVTYWRDNLSAIQFDFFQTDGSGLEQLVPNVERAMYSSWCRYYNRINDEEATIGGLTGKRVRYTLTSNDGEGTKYYSEAFFAVRESIMYVVFFFCPAAADNTSQEPLRKAMDSLTYTEISAQWNLVKIPEFRAEYKVYNIWTPQVISDTVSEKATLYWIDNFTAIQFDFFQAFDSLDSRIPVVEKNLFSSWSKSYKRVSTKEDRIGDLRGRRVVYSLVQNDASATEYYIEAFYAIHNSNMYLSYFLCRPTAGDEVRQKLRRSMNSLRVEMVDHDYVQTAELVKVSFFESNSQAPPLDKRVYETRFAKQATRRVFFQVTAKNLWWQKKSNSVEIVAKYYKPDGSLFGEPVINYTIPQDWETAELWNGWGWDQAGYWDTGVYNVEIFIGGKKVNQTQFEIYDAAVLTKTIEIEKILFFEAGGQVPKDRQFNNRFAKSATRNIYYQVSAKNLLWKVKDNPVKITAKFYKPDGSLFGSPEISYNVPKDWENTELWSGWGWSDPGNWTPGEYRVEVLVAGEKVKDTSFTIFDDTGASLEITDVRFFEAADKIPDEPEYTSRFAKSTTRRVYYQVSAKNLLWKIRDQKVKIVAKYYLPDGNLFGEVPIEYDVPQKWETVELWNGWGWGEPGNWTAGQYRVDVFLGDEKVKQTYFTIEDGESTTTTTEVVEQKTLEIEQVRFFEAGATIPSDRTFDTRFDKKTSRNIYYQVSAKNLLYGKSANPVKIVGKYYLPDGSVFGEPTIQYTIPSDWKTTELWSGWGWSEPGNWTPGKYRVELFIEGKKVYDTSFTIFAETKQTVPKVNWKKVDEPKFQASYQVDPKWTAKKVVDVELEKAMIYWRDNFSAIQFDFFSTPYSLSEAIPQIEKNLYGSWCESYDRIDAKDDSLHGLRGKRISYQLIQSNSGTEYYAEAFYATNSGKLYLAVFFCLAEAEDEVQQALRAALNSLQIGNIEKTSTDTDEIDLPVAEPKWVQVMEKNFPINYEVPANWSKEEEENSSDTLDVSYTGEDGSVSFAINCYATEGESLQEIIDGEEGDFADLFGDSWVQVESENKKLQNLTGVLRSYAYEEEGEPHLAQIFYSVDQGKALLFSWWAPVSASTNYYAYFEHFWGSLDLRNKKLNKALRRQIALLSTTFKERKQNGSKWDLGWGKKSRPDVYAMLYVKEDGRWVHKFTTPVRKDRLRVDWNLATGVYVEDGTELNVVFYDKDYSKPDLIGTQEFTVTNDHLRQKQHTVSFDQVESLTIEFRE